MKKDTVIVIRVEMKLKEKLQKLAAADKRKLADYIRLQLEYIAENKK